MPGLREQIQSSLRGRVCFMGLGNMDGGDDGFGMRNEKRRLFPDESEQFIEIVRRRGTFAGLDGLRAVDFLQ